MFAALMVFRMSTYSSDSNISGVRIEGGCPCSQFFNRRVGANRRGVHLGVIKVYLSEVVGHYLNTLCLVRNTKNKAVVSVEMFFYIYGRFGMSPKVKKYFLRLFILNPVKCNRRGGGCE